MTYKMSTSSIKLELRYEFDQFESWVELESDMCFDLCLMQNLSQFLIPFYLVFKLDFLIKMSYDLV